MTSAIPQLSHWGAYEAIVDRGEVTGIRPYTRDEDPSPLLGNIPGTIRHRSRIAGPMVRAGWLENGPGPDAARGSDAYVAVGWDELTRLVARELRRVIDTHGNSAIFGGSYGWGSAGRFHHAQSQVHRFLNVNGGYVRSVYTYSNAAGEVILDRVLGRMRSMLQRATSWPVIVENTELAVCFGGIPLKNTSVSSGGLSRHTTRGHLLAAAERSIEFVLFSPLRDDLPGFLPVDIAAAARCTLPA